MCDEKKLDTISKTSGFSNLLLNTRQINKIETGWFIFEYLINPRLD